MSLALLKGISASSRLKLKSNFGDCSLLTVATILDTVFLALLHVAIALIDFFSERQISNSLADIYKLNAPCPHLIVPAQTETRGQFAKTLALNLLDGNLRSADSLVSLLLVRPDRLLFVKKVLIIYDCTHS